MGAIPATDAEIEPPEIHDILRNDRRRRALKYLRSNRGSVELRELSEQIAELESGQSPAPRDLRASVYNSLHQTHLPKLDDREVIRYDADAKEIKLHEGARHVDVYMELVTRYGITWSVYYRTLGVLSLLVIVAANTGIPIISDVPTLAWASLFLGVLAVSTAYQLWTRRWFYLGSLLS